MMRLTESRAWEIALAVASPLRGRVGLVADATRSRDIVSSYRWLQLRVPEPDEQFKPALKNTLAWVARARAACVVWHLLACCEGFRGQENGVFWKRVLDAIAHRVKPSDDDETIFDGMADLMVHFGKDANGPWVSDTPRFFDADNGDGSVFPRFQLKIPFSLSFEQSSGPTVTERSWEVSGNESLTFAMFEQQRARSKRAAREANKLAMGLASSADSEDVEIRTAHDWFDAVVRTFAGWQDVTENTSLAGYVEELLPYVDAKQYFDEPVKIGVHLAEFYPLEKMAGKIKQLITDFTIETRTDRATHVDQLKLGKLRFPRVELNEFALDDAEPISDNVELRQLTEIIETCPIGIPTVHVMPSQMIDVATLTRFVRSMCLGRSQQSASVEGLSVEFGESKPRQVEILFSAVPILSVNSLDLLNARGTMGRNGWAWLAYALYSPLTQHSGIKTLDLRDADVTELEAAPLRGISIAHKTMYSMLHGSNDDTAFPNNESSGRYVFVDIQPRTSCFSSSRLRGKPLCSFQKRCRMMAVVDTSVNTVDDLSDAVCVVVTACGHGWVSKSKISAVNVQPARTPSISHLIIGPCVADKAWTISALRPLLKNVSFLDIFAWGYLDTEQMLELFETCSSLRDLVAQHCGEVFNSRPTDTCSSAVRLKGLNLICYEASGPVQAPSQDAWRTCLSELRNLSIHTFGRRAHHEKALVRQFLHDGHCIERFEWTSCEWKQPPSRPSYDTQRAASRSLLGINQSVLDKAQCPMSARARAAFASVIRQYMQHEARHPIGTLPRDVAKWICSFSTTDVDRVVWVEHE